MEQTPYKYNYVFAVCSAICIAFMDVNHNKRKSKDGNDNYLMEGMCFGMCLGTTTSTVFAFNIGVGVSLGMLIGETLGYLINKKRG